MDHLSAINELLYIISSLAPILHLFGRHFVVGWAPLCSKKIICEMLNFTDSTCNNDSSLQINDSKWLDSSCDSTLTRPCHDSLCLDSKKFKVTLARRACDPDSTLTQQNWLGHIILKYWDAFSLRSHCESCINRVVNEFPLPHINHHNNWKWIYYMHDWTPCSQPTCISWHISGCISLNAVAHFLSSYPKYFQHMWKLELPPHIYLHVVSDICVFLVTIRHACGSRDGM